MLICFKCRQIRHIGHEQNLVFCNKSTKVDLIILLRRNDQQVIILFQTAIFVAKILLSYFSNDARLFVYQQSMKIRYFVNDRYPTELRQLHTQSGTPPTRSSE